MQKKNNVTILQLVITGPSMGYTDNYPKREMWQEIAKEYHGEFKIHHDSSNTIEIHDISIPYKKWLIAISVSDTKPLKFTIAFSSGQDFELILSREDFLEKIIKKFGKPEIELGWEEFDKHYLVKSNRSDLTKQMLTTEIQKRLLQHDIYSLSYQTDAKTRTAELISVIQRKAGDKEMILELIDTFKMMIDNLEKSGTIR